MVASLIPARTRRTYAPRTASEPARPLPAAGRVDLGRGDPLPRGARDRLAKGSTLGAEPGVLDGARVGPFTESASSVTAKGRTLRARMFAAGARGFDPYRKAERDLRRKGRTLGATCAATSRKGSTLGGAISGAARKGCTLRRRAASAAWGGPERARSGPRQGSSRRDLLGVVQARSARWRRALGAHAGDSARAAGHALPGVSVAARTLAAQLWSGGGSTLVGSRSGRGSRRRASLTVHERS